LAKALNAVHDAFFTQLNKTLNAFCLGTGNIGRTLFKQLNQHNQFLREKNKIQVKIAGISNSRKMAVQQLMALFR
jgi:aspartokinase/homoserine dehydrogenase 1